MRQASATSGEGHVDISVLVPVLNEERHIRESVAAMQAQRFDGVVELLFADGGSHDRTREILLELALEDPRIRVFDNPRRFTASGLNVCLREARGEYVARMDAHTVYADTYLAAGVERLQRGDTEWVSGPAIPRPHGAVSRAVTLALASRLGRGGSRKWSEDLASAQERELDTGVFGGVWRRERVLAAGGWDERWPVNQDSEMASRFLDRDARLICLPQMAGFYAPRNSLRALARQYYRYGYFRARTFRRHPRSMRVSHLVAPALVGVLVLALLAPSRTLRRGARGLLGAYFAALAATSVSTAARSGSPVDSALLLAALPAMHLGWGFGTLAGTLRFGPPFAALANLAGVGGEAPRASGADVYAPSLHEHPSPEPAGDDAVAA
ncbi:MAG TPA: glycosyltransferase family 2 protein [Solirubrobacteraceae bacterium]|nr:glycosyltransferase family 2 protein [Solirubrobacteraceae bacterium]